MQHQQQQQQPCSFAVALQQHRQLAGDAPFATGIVCNSPLLRCVVIAASQYDHGLTYIYFDRALASELRGRFYRLLLAPLDRLTSQPVAMPSAYGGQLLLGGMSGAKLPGISQLSDGGVFDRTDIAQVLQSLSGAIIEITNVDVKSDGAPPRLRLIMSDSSTVRLVSSPLTIPSPTPLLRYVNPPVPPRVATAPLPAPAPPATAPLQQQLAAATSADAAVDDRARVAVTVVGNIFRPEQMQSACSPRPPRSQPR
jgi:hypothetical protein